MIFFIFFSLDNFLFSLVYTAADSIKLFLVTYFRQIFILKRLAPDRLRLFILYDILALRCLYLQVIGKLPYILRGNILNILDIFVISDLRICENLYLVGHFFYSPNARDDIAPNKVLFLLELLKIYGLLIVINGIISFSFMTKVHKLILLILEQINFLKDIRPLAGYTIDMLDFYYCRFASPHEFYITDCTAYCLHGRFIFFEFEYFAYFYSVFMVEYVVTSLNEVLE